MGADARLIAPEHEWPPARVQLWGFHLHCYCGLHLGTLFLLWPLSGARGRGTEAPSQHSMSSSQQKPDLEDEEGLDVSRNLPALGAGPGQADTRDYQAAPSRQDAQPSPASASFTDRQRPISTASSLCIGSLRQAGRRCEFPATYRLCDPEETLTLHFVICEVQDVDELSSKASFSSSGL